MLKLPYLGSINFAISKPGYTAVLIRSFKKMASSIRDIKLRSEDSVYKMEFIGKFLPALYKAHTSELDMNCVFCKNLIRSSCHKNCLKCRAGTYVYCSPLLPGIPGTEAIQPGSSGDQFVPWYYKNTCPSFKRLELKNYLRNFTVPMSSITIDNFELLEGLTSGLSSGEKPCRICAVEDYDIYKSCSGHKGFDKSTPCDRIASLMASRYTS